MKEKTRFKLCNLLNVFVSMCAVLLLSCTPSPVPKEYADYSRGSGFELSGYDSSMAENLEVLGRVWGFVKYHHPAMADSTYNIDYELFELLPEVVNADNKHRNEILQNWISSFGRFKESADLKITEQDITLPDFEWLQDTVALGSDLSGVLMQLRYADRTKGNHYVGSSRISRLLFNNESDYADVKIDRGYMLLGLFRLWSAIEYYSPNRNITDKNWGDILPEYIEVIMNGDVGQYRNFMARLIAEVNDTHSKIDVSFIFGRRRVPLKMRFIEGELIIEGDPFRINDELGISVGDRIISIDGQTPQQIRERAANYLSLSNEASLNREAARLTSHVHRNQVPRSEVPVSIERYGTRNIVHISLPSISTSEYNSSIGDMFDSPKNTRLLADDIGYFNPLEHTMKSADSVMNVFKNTKAMIVDMRGYPQINLAYVLIPKFLMAQRSPIVTFTVPDFALPGTYREEITYIGEDNNNAYNGGIVVLVNEQTQSAAEFATMAFQALPNCIVVGSQTAGADGNVSNITLPGKINFRISGLGVYYPDGTNAQRAGVKIDHYVTPTIEGVIAGKDEVLERAVEVINEI